MRKEILRVEEIANGYILKYGDYSNSTHVAGSVAHEKSYQWAANNDQRGQLIQAVIDLLGLKHTFELKER